jgi:hypothetical protein
MGWRAALRGERIALPLGLGALGMAALAISPGYGWGYRYLHGFIGSFALLAGLGWASLKRPDQRVLRPFRRLICAADGELPDDARAMIMSRPMPRRTGASCKAARMWCWSIRAVGVT